MTPPTQQASSDPAAALERGDWHTLSADEVLQRSDVDAGRGLSTAEAQARKFKVDPAASQIQFVSDAPLEKFTGTLSNASGQLTVDPNQPASAKGSVKVEKL